MTTQQDIPGRTVYIVSDGTGITAEALARSVLSQFNLTFSRIHIPFVDTLDKVRQAKGPDSGRTGKKRDSYRSFFHPRHTGTRYRIAQGRCPASGRDPDFR